MESAIGLKFMLRGINDSAPAGNLQQPLCSHIQISQVAEIFTPRTAASERHIGTIGSHASRPSPEIGDVRFQSRSAG